MCTGYLFRKALSNKKPNVPNDAAQQRLPRTIRVRPVPSVSLPTLHAESSVRAVFSDSGCQYGLFQRVPVTIRRRILTEAFGHRTIHIDLAFDHPLVRQLSKDMGQSQTEHPHCGLGTQLFVDETQPQRWRCFGCVCHRRNEWTQSDRAHNWRLLGATVGLHDDECLKGTLCACSSAKFQDYNTDSCFIGIMGWLLSCRGALREGLDALFSTSAIHFSGLELQLHLEQLMYPQLLEQITSLELPLGDHVRFQDQHPLSLDLWRSSTGKSRTDTLLNKLCRVIPRTCPKLKKLHVVIQYWVAPFDNDHPAHDRIPFFERNVLRPFEDMLRELGPGGEYNLTIPSGVWYILFKDNHAAKGSDFVCEMDSPVTGRFRKSPKSGEMKTEDIDYWIWSGWNDKLQYMPAHYSEYDSLWGR